MNSDWSRCLSKVGETISLWQCLVIHDMEWEFGYMTAVFCQQDCIIIISGNTLFLLLILLAINVSCPKWERADSKRSFLGQEET